MLAHALLNELFDVFPVLIHVKVCVCRGYVELLKE